MDVERRLAEEERKSSASKTVAPQREVGQSQSASCLVWCEIFLDEQSYQKYRGRVKSAERAGALFECVSRGFGPLLHPFHDDGQAVLPLNTSLVQACRVFEQAPSQEIRG